MACPACRHPNPDDARFCAGCGTRLARPHAGACPGCGAPTSSAQRFCHACGHRLPDPAPAPGRDPRTYVPGHLVEKILSHRRTLEGERKLVTVLFADVAGSMNLAERVDPEVWHRVMDRFVAILADGVHRFEGTINQFTGDGVMALFGAPIAHEDHAQRACHTALHLRDALGRYGAELRRTEGLNFSVRLGLNSGEVVVGTIGDDLRMEYTAQGHTVGLAARVEQLAEPGKVYVTDHTATLVSGYFRLDDLGVFTIRGVREPLRVHELQGVGPLRTRFDLARMRGLSRLVGREAELARLEAALERALAGDGHVVGVVGEPGVGKSRLCHEFVQRCRARGISVSATQGVPHGRSVPFFLLLDLARQYFAITEQDGDQAAREKVAGKLLLLDRDFEEALPLVFDFLGIPDPEHPAPRIDPEARQRQLFALSKRLVPARSRREPAMFLIEDLHWIDGASEGFVAAQAGIVAGTRTLLLVNFRPEYRAAWMRGPRYDEIGLAPLGREAVALLLHELLGGDPSLAALAELVRRRTGGNPFFIEEVVQGLAETGHLRGTKGAYRLVRPIDEVIIPASVQVVLAARIDGLGETAKAVLQTAAVVGKRFWERVLRRVVDLSETELAESLRVLTEAEFIFPEALHPEVEYAFKHPLTQEVAYHSLLGEHRMRVHGAVARTIMEIYPDRAGERAGLVAHHWEGAGAAMKAAQWSRRAAEWVRGSDSAEAFRHWQKIHALMQTVPPSPERTELVVQACIQLLELGWRLGLGIDEARALFHEGEALARAGDDLQALAMVVNAFGVVRSQFGDVDDWVDCTLEASALAEQTTDAGLQLAIRTRLVIALITAGRLPRALELCDATLAEPVADPRLGAAILGYSPFVRLMNQRGKLLIDLGRLEEGARELERGGQLARDEGDVEILGFTHGEYVTLARIRGDAEAALVHARETMRIAEKLGSPFFRAGAHLSFGQAHILAGRWPEARAALEQALAIARAGAAFAEAEPLALAWLAGAHLGAGDTDLALGAADEALAVAQRRRTRVAECIAHIGRARVLLRTAGARAGETVEAALGRALALVEETGARSNEPFVRVQRARLAALCGDRDTWERELRAAHELFAGMGATPRADKLARELA